MIAPVHILYTVRKEELRPFSDLVFKTLKVGFPTAKVFVHDNHTGDITHHDWITTLLDQNTIPFWICDADMIFYDKVEDWTFDKPIAGRRIPQWNDEFTGCITRSRLHTSLMYLDPSGIKDRLEKYKAQFPDTPFNPFAHLINPLCVPWNGRTYFYDTTSLLYHAIGGQTFTALQLESYSHLNFGTIEDIVLPRLTGGEQMRALRREILEDPIKGKGLWRVQEAYYQSRPA